MQPRYFAVARNHHPNILGRHQLRSGAGLARTLRRHNIRAAPVAVNALHLLQFFNNQRPHFARRCQQRFQLLDEGLQLLELILQFLHLQLCQPAQRHVQDGAGLQLAEAEALHNALARIISVVGVADDLDNFIQVAQRRQQAFNNMRAFARAQQIKFSAPAHHFHTVI